MDDEIRKLERRRALGEDVTRELEAIRRRNLTDVERTILRMCMAAKVAWRRNVTRGDRAVLVAHLAHAFRNRSLANWKKGQTIVLDRALWHRPGMHHGEYRSIADVNEVTLEFRADFKSPTLHRRMTFAAETILALVDHYGGAVKLERLANGFRVTDTTTIAEDMHQAIQRFRAFMDTPGRPIPFSTTNAGQDRFGVSGGNMTSGNVGHGTIHPIDPLAPLAPNDPRLDRRAYDLPILFKHVEPQPRLVRGIRQEFADEYAKQFPALAQQLGAIGRQIAIDLERRTLEALTAPDDLSPRTDPGPGDDRIQAPPSP
jgi:hypothetical protein